MDGNSSDGTMDVLREIDRINCRWISEPDKGIYDAMNKGVKMASGEWLLMLNAGDIFANEHVLEEVFANQIPDSISVLYSDYYRFLPDGSRPSTGERFKNLLPLLPEN